MMQYDADRASAKRLGRLRRHWRWILPSALLSMLAALIISRAQPKIYAATTYILVSESKISTALPDPWQYSLLPTYIPVIDSDALIAQAVQHFHLDGAPYRLTPHRFRQGGYLDVRIPKSTRLIEIDVEFPDARLAADLANYLARSAVELNDQTNALETLATQKFLKERLDQGAAHLEQAESNRLRVKKETRLEDKEKELSILLSDKEEVSTQVEKLRMSATQNEARAKSLAQALSNEPRILQLKKSVTSDRFLERASEKLAPAKEGELSVTEETLSTTHEELQRQFVTATADTQAGQAAIRSGSARLVEINEQIKRLLVDLTLSRSEIEKADRDFSLAREAFESATRDYRNASVTVTSKSQDLKQVAPALIPDRPVRPKLLLNSVLAGLMGLALSCGIALARESYREMQAQAIDLAGEDEHVGVRHS